MGSELSLARCQLLYKISVFFDSAVFLFLFFFIFLPFCLLNETRMIQKRLPQQQKPQATEEKAKIFAKLVLEGNAEIRLLDDDTSSGVSLLPSDVIKT